MNFSAYLIPLETALWSFPLIALIIALPYAIFQYHRFGSMSVVRSVLFYVFVFYLLCTYFLIILPLPDPATISPETLSQHVVLEPLESLRDYVSASNMNLARKSVWLKILESPAMLQLVCNVIMTIPFGIYLRYYFGRTWRQTLLASFCLSLFFELTQLSGLYGIYSAPYRTFEVDDLATSTLGGMVGFWIAPLFARFLPGRGDLDARARKQSMRVTLFRRFAAKAIDWIPLIVLWMIAAHVVLGLQFESFAYEYAAVMALLGLYEMVWLAASGGRTPGKMVCHVCVVGMDGERAPAWRLILRVLLEYGVVLGAPATSVWLLSNLGGWPTLVQYAIGAFCLFLLVIMVLAVYETIVKLFGGSRPYLYASLSGTQSISTYEADELRGAHAAL